MAYPTPNISLFHPLSHLTRLAPLLYQKLPRLDSQSHPPNSHLSRFHITVEAPEVLT